MKVFRFLLRLFCKTFPIRGRHRLANTLGKYLAPSSEEIVMIGDIAFPIDHSVEMYRYVYYGIYEEHFINLLKRIIRKGDIIIEPGANIGYITAMLSSLTGEKGKVFSLEPSRICYKKIETYLKQNNIKLMHAAIADVDGSLNFIDKSIVISHGYSSFSLFTGKKDSDNEYSIPTITIDSLMARNQLSQVRLLKLDVEGAELMALEGARLALSGKKIDYILVETEFRDEQKVFNEKIRKLLMDEGYRSYAMTSRKLIPMDYNSIENHRQDVIWTHLNQ